MSFKASELFERYPILESCRQDMDQALSILETAYKNQGKLLIMGNGGSSADAEHFPHPQHLLQH